MLHFYSMKLLNVFCENRKAEVFVNLDKIILITKLDDHSSLVELEGGGKDAVKVALSAEDLVRKINGEDKVSIGFRTGR